jgi:hypothetical protein
VRRQKTAQAERVTFLLGEGCPFVQQWIAQERYAARGI